MAGVIICEKHGSQLPLHVCLHIYEKFKANIYEKKILIEFMGFYICKKCIDSKKFENILKISLHEALNLPENEQLKLEKKFIDSEEIIERNAICPKCYKELKN